MAAAKARDTQAKPTVPPLVVRYPARMRSQRPYSVQVSWKSKEKTRLPEGSSPYTVRLVMAGAQVIPSQQTMDPSQPAKKATFYVTPLVRKGWLKGERLEVLNKGEKVQEIALPAKVTSQFRTWILLILTIFIPWYLVTQVQGRTYQDEKGSPWDRLVYEMEKEPPVVPEAAKEQIAETLKEFNIYDWASEFADDFGGAYDLVVMVLYNDEIVLNDEEDKAVFVRLFVPFILMGLLLLLTIFSWFRRREKIKKRTGKPLPMPEGEY